MRASNNKRRKIFANKLHRQVLLLIFFAILLPVIITILCLYYLIFNLTAMQFMIPEAIIHNVIPVARKVTFILLISLPIVISTILIIAYKITHVIVGPFERITNELGKRVENMSSSPISLRKGDKFKPLVDNINKLLAKLDTN